MSNLLGSLKKYASSWTVVSVEPFTEASDVKSNEVVPSEYGLSVCMELISGGKVYIPLDRDSSAAAGDVLDLPNCKIKTLEKDGEVIYRIL